MIGEMALKKITDYFTNRNDTIAVYLFGSTAKGKERKTSDLDLAVLFEEGLDQHQRFQAKLQMVNDLEDHLKTKIDLVDLRSADLFFIHQIMRKIIRFRAIRPRFTQGVIRGFILNSTGSLVRS